MVKNNVTTKADLLMGRFKILGTMHYLQNYGLPQNPELEECGVYAVVIPPDYQVSFFSPEELDTRRVVNPWQIEKLREKWVEGAEVVYFGMTGRKKPRSLKKRLTAMIKHSKGRTSNKGPHKGGEILWQLRGYGSFEVLYLPTDKPPRPRQIEKELISRFYRSTRKKPFANRQF